MVMVGPVNSGKSLVQNLFTEILGGRSAKPYLFMSRAGHPSTVTCFGLNI